MSDSLVARLTYRSELDAATAAALVARLGTSVVSKTATYSAAAGDCVLADASGGAFTVHLPAPSVDARVTVKNVGATNTVTVDTPGTETIDGAASVALATQWDTKTFVSDGTNWFTV